MPLDTVKNPLWELDTDKITSEVAAELLRQAEMRQEAIFRAAVGMDQRAAVLAAGLIAAAGAIAAAGVALGQGNQPLRVAAFVGAFCAAVSAGLCAWACRPQKFRFPGLDPLSWGADPAYLQEPLHVLQLARVAQLQDHVSVNESRQARNGQALFFGLRIAAATPVIVIIVWAVASAMS